MREGPVQTEAPQPLGAQLTIRRVISEVGPAPGSSGVSQGRASLRSGMSPTEVGDARIFLIISAGRGATSHRRQGWSCSERVTDVAVFGHPEGLGSKVGVPVDIEATPDGYGIVQDIDP